MSYQAKYLKYKNKYLQLKNQIGGYTLKLEEWNKIENSGQHNCGIFLSDKYPKYILKCDSDNKLDIIIEINNKIQLFPKIINSTKKIKDSDVSKGIGMEFSGLEYFTNQHSETYITMQKLDGDITNIYFNLFPRIVLKNMIDRGLINKKQEETIFDLFVGKSNYTMQNSKDLEIYINKFNFDRLIEPEIHTLYIEYLRANPQIIDKSSDINIKGYIYKNIYNRNIESVERDYHSYKNKLDKMKTFSNISLELYDNFMNQLLDLWKTHHEIIIKEIIKIKLLLAKLGYGYNDPKLDNFGYILSTTPIDDFRKYQAPRIFGKYLYVYFLDWESGLLKFGDFDSTNSIIKEANNGLSYYMANGQYKFSDINANKIRNNSGENLDLLGINHEILKILQKPYKFDLSGFQHSFTTIEEVEKFINQ